MSHRTDHLASNHAASDHVVVDTNVAVTANGANVESSAECMVASIAALHGVLARGHVYIDDGGAMMAEYRRNLPVRGQPGAGDLFLRWLLTHEWGGARVTRVRITPKEGDPTDYEEFPAAPAGVAYDPSDRKFLAVAASHERHPHILQATDSKWWGWREALAVHGVRVRFLCPAEIEAKFRQKLG